MEEGKVQLARFILAALGETVVSATVTAEDTSGSLGELPGTLGGRSLLMYAARLSRSAGRAHFLSLLLSRGAEVDWEDGEGRTALSLVCESGYLNTVRFLVLHGADPEKADHRDVTPLAYAARGRHSTVVRFLLQELRKSREMMEEEVVEEEKSGLLAGEQKLDCYSQAGDEGNGGGLGKQVIKQRPTQERASKAGVESGRGQGQLERHTQIVDFRKTGCGNSRSPRGRQYSLPLPENTGYSLCESTVSGLLFTDHVICNPYALEIEEKESRREEKWTREDEGKGRNPTCLTSAPDVSPLHLYPLNQQVTPNPVLLCQAGKREEESRGYKINKTFQHQPQQHHQHQGEEEEEERRGCCEPTLETQEQQHSERRYYNDTDQHHHSQLPNQTDTTWGRFFSLWLRRKTCATTNQLFTGSNPTVPRDSTTKPSGSFRRWLTLKHLLLTSGSGPHTVLDTDKLYTSLDSSSPQGESTVQSLQPCFSSRPTVLRNRCFLEEGELAIPLHKDHACTRASVAPRWSHSEVASSDTCGLSLEKDIKSAREEKDQCSERDQGKYQYIDKDRGKVRDRPLKPFPWLLTKSTSFCPALRSNPIQPTSSSGSGCNVFKVLRRHTAPDLRLYLGEESDTDLEEPLVQDEHEDDGDNECTETNRASD